jgi:hypothetical protein
MTFPLELVGRFEQHAAEAVESLLTHSLTVPGNPEGYALFREGAVRATLSRNPYARWATQTWGLSGRDVAVVPRLVEFFNQHGVPASVRVVPDAVTPELADALADFGLRHVTFHTMLWSPLPLPSVASAPVDIREVSTPAELDAHIDIQLGAYDASPEVIDRLRPLRRTWLGSRGRRFYLAYVDGRPAAQAVLHWRDDIAYLESAGTLPAYRRRGLQHALIRRRIADATALGCHLIIGGTVFENDSRRNQMACGLATAYLAAVWIQRPDRMRAPAPA